MVSDVVFGQHKDKKKVPRTVTVPDDDTIFYMKQNLMKKQRSLVEKHAKLHSL